MTAEECRERAARCATNASMAADVSVAVEFAKLAAQWRAMAERLIYVGPCEDRVRDLRSAEPLPQTP
jgi:hypothetical protein